MLIHLLYLWWLENIPVKLTICMLFSVFKPLDVLLYIYGMTQGGWKLILDRGAQVNNKQLI